MNLDLEKYYSLITNHPDAFAYHQIVTDDNGNPVDYVFLEVNSAFEEMTGLSKNKIIGKKVTEVLPGIEKSEFDWIGTYGQVALSGKATRFESFSEALGRWYAVTAYSDEPGGFVTLFRDISEQKKNEQALIDSEEKHRRLFETMTQGVVYQAADGKIISANPAAERMLGLTFDQMQGKTSMDPRWQMIEEDGTPEPGEVHPVMIALRSGQVVGPVIRGVYRPDLDKHVWINITAIPLFQPCEDKPFQAYTSFEDITERKQAEEALRKSEERFRVAQEISPDGFTILHPLRNDKGEIVDFTWVYENQAIANINNTDPQKVIGKRLLDLFPDHSGTPIFEAYIQAANTGKPQIFEEVNVGEVVSEPTWLRLVIVPMAEDIAILALDISERKHAEKALKESEALLDDTGFMARVGGWQIDAETMALTWTKETYRIHEIPLDYKPPVDKALEFFHPDDREVLSQAIQLALSRGEPYDMELPFTTAKGNNLWVRTICRPEVVDGKTVKLRGSFQDITERKQAEEEIRTLNTELEQRVSERTIELAAVNKELVSFAYSVSHDFRAPLRALNAFSANLTEKYSDQLDEQGLHYLDRINKASLYMSDLVDDLLKLSRITRTEMNPQEVDISQTAAEIIQDLQIAEPERQVKVEVAPGLSAKGDLALLKDALANLIGNAWKFSSKEPKAKIEVGRMTKDGEEAFFVRDNGVGFNINYANKLFGAFQRLHGVNEFPGNGIGLASVQRIIIRHGGWIWAESEVGKGATFYFTLK